MSAKTRSLTLHVQIPEKQSAYYRRHGDEQGSHTQEVTHDPVGTPKVSGCHSVQHNEGESARRNQQDARPRAKQINPKVNIVVEYGIVLVREKPN